MPRTQHSTTPSTRFSPSSTSRTDTTFNPFKIKQLTPYKSAPLHVAPAPPGFHGHCGLPSHGRRREPRPAHQHPDPATHRSSSLAATSVVGSSTAIRAKTAPQNTCARGTRSTASTRASRSARSISPSSPMSSAQHPRAVPAIREIPQYCCNCCANVAYVEDLTTTGPLGDWSP